MLGSLEGSWKVFLEFPQKDEAAGTGTILGLRFWKAISPDGKHISMKLEKGRRVRLDLMGPLVRLPRSIDSASISLSFIHSGLERKTP